MGPPAKRAIFRPTDLISAAPRVAIIGNQADTMVRFRGSLLSLLRERGADVFAICPPASEDEHRQLAALGVQHIPIHRMSRSSVNPLDDLRLVAELTGILRKLAPTHMLSYFLKPAIYGTLAGRRAGVPRRIAMIEGLGFAFSGGEAKADAKRRVARILVTRLLRHSLQQADGVIVLNRDDATFLQKRCAVPSTKIHQIDGIGVDIDEFAEQPPAHGPANFCLAARLIREKGVIEFVEAARRIRASHPSASFTLLGEVDDNPSAIQRSDIEAWVSRGDIEWRGKVEDVRPYLARARAFVLPSYYGEGLPRSIMEAMAMGRAVVTTTAPGCRDSVTNGISGLIIPPKDVDALTAVLMRLADEPDLAVQMGMAAALEARRRYDRSSQDFFVADLILGAPPANAVCGRA